MLKKQKFTKIINSLLTKKLRFTFFLSAIVVSLFLLIYNLVFFKKIYPSIHISGVAVSGQSKDEAVSKLKNTIQPPSSLILISDSQKYNIDLADYNFYYDFKASVDVAYKRGRSGQIFNDLAYRLALPFKKTNLTLIPRFDEDKLKEHLSIVASELTHDPSYPSAKLAGGQVVIEKGSPGKTIDYQKLTEEVFSALSENPLASVNIPAVVVDPSINDDQAQLFRQRATSLIGKSVKLSLDDEGFFLDEDDLFSFLNPEGGYLQNSPVLEEIALFFNREPQNPVFVFLPAQAGEGGRVTEFAAAKEGIKVNESSLSENIVEKIFLLETSDTPYAEIEVPASVAPPEITTEEVNNLGIKELLGRGRSTFFGSISSRIHNIGLASSHFNGVLADPGEIFSFNDTLGDVSTYTGYKQAYIIQNGRTVLGDGGGVCQVSTTLFRAILDAGLPVVERRAHSYRVAYYEQGFPPGLDATVYAPTTDLKFKNDTPSSLLIQTIFNPASSSLTFEIYGTNDGRVAKTTKPVIYGTTPPPEDLYQDDPTLPTGTIKQIDYKAWGANVTFNYEVEKNGEIIYQKEFISNYHPWQAVYLRGTGPVN